MATVKIIALDGFLSSEIGWAIPIVEETQKFYFMGEGFSEARDLGELQGLIDSKDVTPVNATDYAFDEKKEDDDVKNVKNLVFCRPFDSPVLGFYWRDETAREWSIDIKKFANGYVSLSTAASAGVQIRLLPRSVLIPCLREILEALCRNFRRVLADDMKAYLPLLNVKSYGFANNARLRRLADMAYRLAPDRGWATDAIAQQIVLILAGDHPTAAPNWLRSVTRFWRLPAVLKYWHQKAEAIVAAAQQDIALERIPKAATLWGSVKEVPSRKDILSPAAENSPGRCLSLKREGITEGETTIAQPRQTIHTVEDDK